MKRNIVGLEVFQRDLRVIVHRASSTGLLKLVFDKGGVFKFRLGHREWDLSGDVQTSLRY